VTRTDGSGNTARHGGDGGTIDVAAGLERLMGNRPMYLRALKRFCSDHEGAPAAIRAALAAGDDRSARRLVHTLKGVAGMIEAGRLQRHALALEQALQGVHGPVAIEVELVEVELGRVFAEAQRLLAGEAAGPPAAGSPVAAVPDPVWRLRELLDLGDGAAVDLIGNARPELLAALGAERYGAIAAAIDSFDFEKALRLLGAPASAE
jgi:HPt (histidine-containing phosphotransfer) domain-containing protein